MPIDQIPTAANAEAIRQKLIRIKSELITACVVSIIVSEIGIIVGLDQRAAERKAHSLKAQSDLATAIVDLKNI